MQLTQIVISSKFKLKFDKHIYIYNQVSNQIHKCFICLIYIFVFNFYPLSNFIKYKIYTTFLKSHTYEISSIHILQDISFQIISIQNTQNTQNFPQMSFLTQVTVYHI